jgi:hypothetical protein
MKVSAKFLFKTYEMEVFNPGLKLLNTQRECLGDDAHKQISDGFFALHDSMRTWLQALEQAERDKKADQS